MLVVHGTFTAALLSKQEPSRIRTILQQSGTVYSNLLWYSTTTSTFKQLSSIARVIAGRGKTDSSRVGKMTVFSVDVALGGLRLLRPTSV